MQLALAFTVWTKMMPLTGSLAVGVLADAISPTTDTANQFKEGRGSVKKVQKLVTEKPFTSKEM